MTDALPRRNFIKASSIALGSAALDDVRDLTQATRA
jgi:hypothetical protein